MSEWWKKVPQYPFLEVSSKARVRRCGPGLTKLARIGHIFKQRLQKYGKIRYFAIRVPVQGKRKLLRVHRLVCMAFHGRPPSRKHHAAHRNGNPKNNFPINIYWATPQQNVDDTARLGRTPKGETTGTHKLRNAEIGRIRKLGARGVPQREIGRQFNISQCQVHNIVTRKQWRHL